MQRSLWVYFFICFSIILTACSDNDDNNGGIQLLGKIEFQQNITDVWGYVDSAGKEYALVGFSGGIHIVDVNNPQEPVLVSTVDTVPGFDVKVWQNYAYTVNGSGNGLGGIIDISDPAKPEIVGSFPSSHNIFISEAGYMYLETERANLRAYNLNPDPKNPTLIWTGTTSDGHDAIVKDNRLYDFAARIATNIYDVTNPASPRLEGSISRPALIAYHHSGWPSENGDFLFICHEITNKGDPDLTVWDIRDPGNPKLVTEYDDKDTNVHNLYIIGNFAYTSYYNSGFRIFDVSDPANIVVVDEFDTSPDVDTGRLFQGAFGVYPFAPSGNIYVTDVTDGLFIFSFNSGQTSTNIVAP